MKHVISIVAMVIVVIAIFRCNAADDVLAAEGTCQCAVFKDNEAHGEEAVPVIQKTPGFTVTCDEEGHGRCLQMCTALAQAAKESAPVMLCEAIQDLNNGFQPSVFSKACDTVAWSYTGLTAAVPICCTAGKQAACTVQAA